MKLTDFQFGTVSKFKVGRILDEDASQEINTTRSSLVHILQEVTSYITLIWLVQLHKSKTKNLEVFYLQGICVTRIVKLSFVFL